MANKGPLSLRIFQWTLWSLLLLMVLYYFVLPRVLVAIWPAPTPPTERAIETVAKPVSQVTVSVLPPTTRI